MYKKVVSSFFWENPQWPLKKKQFEFFSYYGILICEFITINQSFLLNYTINKVNRKLGLEDSHGEVIKIYLK